MSKIPEKQVAAENQHRQVPESWKYRPFNPSDEVPRNVWEAVDFDAPRREMEAVRQAKVATRLAFASIFCAVLSVVINFL